jgi:DNA polymerase-1
MCEEEPFSVFSLDELREFQPEDNKYIHCLTDFSEIISYLNNFDKDSFVFDIETTGLKPFVNGHKIVSFACGSLATKDVYSFPIEYPNIFSTKEQRAIFTAIRKILENPNIKKIAHNLQFEHVWCRVIFGANTVGWYEDTMLKSRVLDNRSKFAGLKHQSFVRLGIMPYDSFIKPYLDSGKEQFNKICRAPLEQLLYYGGVDVLATGAISKYYEWAMPEPSEAYNLLHAGTLSFAELQLNGMGADLDYYQTKNVQLQKEIAQKKETILKTEEAISFKKTYHKPIDIASPKDLGELVYDVLKFPPVLTDKNNYCVDVDALSKIDNEFVQQLLKIRKLEKIQGTYLSQFLRNIVNNRIHAMFGLGTAVTYRSSSSNPNWQNIPIRDNLAKQICRGGLVPSKGNLLIEADYSGVEVRIGVCYHKDPNMITYITDPTADMHRDTAADLWLLNADEVTKEIRQSGKGDWVFPQFYGSWYLECGKNAWETCINGNLKLKDGRPLCDHIAEHGITCVDDFIEHCKDVENIFWGTRFKGYSDWRKEIHKFYMQNGYVETYLGFRYQGYMTRNETSNYPIQGTAFHCLLTTLIRLINKAKEEKWKSKFIGQIHDSLIVDVVPEEKDYVIETIHNIGTKELMDLYDWIIVPIEMDFEITDIDQPWSTKKEI